MTGDRVSLGTRIRMDASNCRVRPSMTRCSIAQSSASPRPDALQLVAQLSAGDAAGAASVCARASAWASSAEAASAIAKANRGDALARMDTFTSLGFRLPPLWRRDGRVK
jgi:hypothetical protein